MNTQFDTITLHCIDSWRSKPTHKLHKPYKAHKLYRSRHTAYPKLQQELQLHVTKILHSTQKSKILASGTMLLVTQSWSKSQEPCRHSNNMPDNFNNLDPIDSSSSKNLLDNLLDELTLKTHLDLSQHPAHKLIDLPEHHKFHSASEFCCIVAANRARVLYLLACIVEYDVIIHKKVTKHYAEWEQVNRNYTKAFRNITRELIEAKKRLA